MFYSEDEAATASVAEKNALASGMLIKDGDKIRLQVLYKEKPSQVGKNIIASRSSDNIINGKYFISFNPEQSGNYVATGSLNKLTSNAEISNSIPELANIDSPLSLALSPVSSVPSNTTLFGSPEVSVLENNRVVLTLNSSAANESTYTKETTFIIDTKIPVIEKVVIKNYCRGSSDPQFVYTRMVTEWCIVNTNAIPKTIRAISGPLKSKGNTKDSWIVSEWQSKDLGENEPQDSDFVLDIPKNISLLGMNFIPRDGKIDIDQITDADFVETGVDFGPEEKTVSSTARVLWVRLIMVVVGFLLIVFACLKTYQKRKNTTENDKY